VCGRYAAGKERDALAVEFEVDSATSRHLPARWNIAPTAPIYIVKESGDGGIPARELTVAAWGLVPSWAADISIGGKMANARCETVGQKPSFRSAFARRRCLVPVDGWYEWAAADRTIAAKARPPKQPYYFCAPPTSGASTALAGIYEWWRDPTDPDAEPLLSAAIITTDAYGDLAKVHTRTPVIVPPSMWAQWLNPHPSTPAATVLAELVAALPDTPVTIHPVSTRVNSARIDDAGLVVPIDLSAQAVTGIAAPAGRMGERLTEPDAADAPGQSFLF
jgi:putative SOS response-associated peptidase YedK